MRKLVFCFFAVMGVVLCGCSPSSRVDNSTAENTNAQQMSDKAQESDAGDENGMKPSESAKVAWMDTFKYGFVLPKSEEAAKIVEFAQGKCAYETLVPRNKLGNLVFVEGTTSAKAQDGDNETGYCGVLLGDENMSFVSLPDKVLLAQLIGDIRKAPEGLSLDRRISFVLKLGIGKDWHLSKDEMEARDFESKYGIKPIDPVWLDDAGTIRIEYYQMKVEGMQVSRPQKCIVTIAADAEISVSCEDL